MEPPFKNPLDFLDGIQCPVPFSKEDWEKTPEAVRAYIPFSVNPALLHPSTHRAAGIQMEVIHFVLHRGQCPCCGKTVKATLPNAYRAGFGPRLSTSVAKLAGGQGDSRSLTREFCSSVLDHYIGDWVGILVSDGYGLYRKWVGLRQTCLAHLIRRPGRSPKKRIRNWPGSESGRFPSLSGYAIWPRCAQPPASGGLSMPASSD
jgi:hypothetical protein